MNLNGFRDNEFLEEIDEKDYLAQIQDNMKKAPFQIRDYQDKAVRAALKYHKGILLSCTSSGKSLMIYNIIRCLRKQEMKHILLIVPNIMLVDQMYDDFESYGYDNLDDDVERLGGGHEATFDKPVLISTWQSLQNKDSEFFEKYNAVFTDECVSGNTYIRTPTGEKRITDIKEGDLVVSYNEKTGKFENKKVLETFVNHTSSKSAKMYRLELENGRILELTGNHPVYTTNRGWVRAEKLTENDDLKLQEYDLLKDIENLSVEKQNELKNYIEKYTKTNAFNKFPNLDEALYKKFYLNDNTIFKTLTHKLAGMIGGINLGINGTLKGKTSPFKGQTKYTNPTLMKLSKTHAKHNKENDPRIAKLTFETKMGQNNPMSKTKYKGYRKVLSKKQSITLKNKIKNNEFTPNSNNRLCHIKLEYDGIKFRSSWEVVFHYFNKNMLYEKIRIPYTLEDGEHVYISDFYDKNTNTIYEIKPNKIYNDLKIKMTAIEESISKNTNYNYIHLGDEWAKSVIIPENCDINDEILQCFKRGLR